MSWVSLARRVVSAAAISAAAGGIAVAGPIVVRASGPSARAYAPGTQLADTARITLKAGDQLVLVDARGTRTLAGPGSFAASGSATRMGLSATAARFIATQNAQERRGGAVRGGGGETAAASSPNIWFIVPGQSGTHCLIDPAAAKLWRAGTDQPATIDIKGKGTAGQVAIAAGRSLADWPASVPIADGAEYTLSGAGVPSSRLRIALVAADPDQLDDVAAKLIARGCTAQLDLMVKVLSPIGSGN